MALRYAVRQLATLLGGLPLALWGLASHALPYWLTWAAARLLRPEPDVEATYKLVAGVVIYPLAWIAEGWLLWRVGRRRGRSRSSSSCSSPGGFFALAWSERLRRLYRESARAAPPPRGSRPRASPGRAPAGSWTRWSGAVARVPEPVLAGREEPSG